MAVLLERHQHNRRRKNLLGASIFPHNLFVPENFQKQSIGISPNVHRFHSWLGLVLLLFPKRTEPGVDIEFSPPEHGQHANTLGIIRRKRGEKLKGRTSYIVFSAWLVEDTNPATAVFS